PRGQMPYEPVGDLVLSFPEAETVSDYRRDLNLDTAAAAVSFSSSGVHFTREVFASAVDQVIALRLSADQPGRISFGGTLVTRQQAKLRIEGNDTLILDGFNGSADGIPGSLKFQLRVRVVPQGGYLKAATDSVTVTNADSIVLLIAVATSYKNFKDVSGD